MSTPAVSSSTGHTASSGTHASTKSSGASGDKAGKAGANQAPKGDVFAMLLMMLGDGPNLAPDAGMATGDEEVALADLGRSDETAQALSITNPLASTNTAAAGLGQTDTDPVQAMLASRYPLERNLARTGMSAPEPGVASAGQGTGGVDITTLGMQTTTDGELPQGLTLPSDMKPAEAPTPSRPTPGMSLQRQDPQGIKAARLPLGNHVVMSHITNRAMTDMTAQTAAAFATRSGEAMTWTGGLPIRSTVQLDTRLSSQDSMSSSTGDLDTLVAAGSVGSTQAQGSGHSGEQGHPMSGESGMMDKDVSETDTSGTEQFAQAQAAAEDEAAELWHAGQLQQARLSIAGEAGESIEVQLQLAGESVHVEFRTDDENARQQLAQDGGRDLSGRLEQEGLSLIDVSVGGRQGSGTSQGKPGNASTMDLGRTSAQRRGSDASDLSSPVMQGLRPRTDPGRPLDMFV